MQNDASAPARESVSSAPPSHRESLPAASALPHLEHVIRKLVPSGRRAEITALFDGKAPYNSIKDWRKGRRYPPAWAIDMVQKRVAEIADHASKIRSGPGVSTHGLRAWHARNKDVNT